ncbi:MAG: hypothetical protein EON91_03785 [Brevundimonas sp.]|uniref:hypothetical protein n=1 Tax=Brevundimonas sp. TaxID=1871086 RepID=UPI0012219ED4|nr:hypothetical protein [Brevundimonas sp.]RZJ18776.1 MAG: hypothetical protein EON91_03785 [Brevundimonas sp.]
MAERQAGRARRLIIGAFALGVLGLSGGLVLALAAPQIPSPLASSMISVREARSDALAHALAPADLDRALTEAHAALKLSPAAATVWLRVADLETRKAGGLTPAALEALERSYEAAPLGPDVTLWRLTFLFERWRDLPAPLRQKAIAELSARSKTRARSSDDFADTIQDPAGRLAARMAVRIALREKHPNSANSVIQ